MAISNTTYNFPYTRSQAFTTSGTFIHPDGYGSPKPVKVLCYGAGGGGGSGTAVSYATGVFSTLNSGYYYGALGGGGGGSGTLAMAELFINGNQTVTIGAAGSGGAAYTATSGTYSGNSGTTGGTSTFGGITALGGVGGSSATYLNSSSSTYMNTNWNYGGQGGSAGGNGVPRSEGQQNASTTLGAAGASNGLSTGANCNNGSYYAPQWTLGQNSYPLVPYLLYSNSTWGVYPKEKINQIFKMIIKLLKFNLSKEVKI